MIKILWLLFFTFEVCHMEISTGCCGVERNKTCSKCCKNYHFENGQCEACPLGFYGDNCNLGCAYPYYGELCRLSCKDRCPMHQCHKALGCQNQESGSLTTSRINLRPETSRTTHGNDTKNRPSRTTHKIPDALTKIKVLVTERHSTVIGSIVKTPSSAKSPMTTESTIKEQQEDDPDSKDALWLFSVLRQLGITFVVCLVIIVGLVCLFICKKRRERASIKSLKVSSRGEQDDSNLRGDGHRNSNTESSLYQGLPNCYPLRKADEKGRSDSTRSTNTYMEPLTRQEFENESSVQNPCYHDVEL